MAHDLTNLTGRELVLEVACELFMEKGYEGVSMQQIADAAHMTKGSPYYHFKGKEDLFAHAFMLRVSQLHAGLIARLESDIPFRDRLVESFAYMLATTDAGLFRLIDDFKRVIGHERAEEYVDKLIKPDEMLASYVATFGRAASEGVSLRIAPDRAAWLLNALQVGALHMLYSLEDGVGTPEQAHDIATDVVDTFLNGALLNP